MYSLIKQFAKLAAGEQLCRRCTHRKLYHFKTLKSFSWKITNFDLWYSCRKWAIYDIITNTGQYETPNGVIIHVQRPGLI